MMQKHAPVAEVEHSKQSVFRSYLPTITLHVTHQRTLTYIQVKTCAFTVLNLFLITYLNLGGTSCRRNVSPLQLQLLTTRCSDGPI